MSSTDITVVVMSSSVSGASPMVLASGSGSVNGTRGGGRPMSRSASPGKKDMGRLLVNQGGRGFGVVWVLVDVSGSNHNDMLTHGVFRLVISLFCWM